MANSHKKRWNRQLKLRKLFFQIYMKKTNCKNYYILFLEKEKIKFEKKITKKKILVYDVPLIYETKSENNYDR